MRCGRLAAIKSLELDPSMAAELDHIHSSLLEPGVEISISLVAAVLWMAFVSDAAVPRDGEGLASSTVLASFVFVNKRWKL